MFSLFKSPLVAKSGYKIDKDHAELVKTTMEKEINMFKELQEDFSKLMLIGEVELFLKGGSTEIIDQKLAAALLPGHKNTYINIMGAIRFIHLHGDAKSYEYEKLAIELFESLVQEDGADIVDTISNVIESMSPLKTQQDVFKVSMSGNKLAITLSKGILEEQGDMVSKITRINENKHVQERVKAFFDIVSKLSY